MSKYQAAYSKGAVEVSTILIAVSVALTVMRLVSQSSATKSPDLACPQGSQQLTHIRQNGEIIFDRCISRSSAPRVCPERILILENIAGKKVVYCRGELEGAKVSSGDFKAGEWDMAQGTVSFPEPRELPRYEMNGSDEVWESFDDELEEASEYDPTPRSDDESDYEFDPNGIPESEPDKDNGIYGPPTPPQDGREWSLSENGSAWETRSCNDDGTCEMTRRYTNGSEQVLGYDAEGNETYNRQTQSFRSGYTIEQIESDGNFQNTVTAPDGRRMVAITDSDADSMRFMGYNAHGELVAETYLKDTQNGPALMMRRNGIEREFLSPTELRGYVMEQYNQQGLPRTSYEGDPIFERLFGGNASFLRPNVSYLQFAAAATGLEHLRTLAATEEAEAWMREIIRHWLATALGHADVAVLKLKWVNGTFEHRTLSPSQAELVPAAADPSLKFRVSSTFGSQQYTPSSNSGTSTSRLEKILIFLSDVWQSLWR